MSGRQRDSFSFLIHQKTGLTKHNLSHCLAVIQKNSGTKRKLRLFLFPRTKHLFLLKDAEQTYFALNPFI
jgi:hypothetical protein